MKVFIFGAGASLGSQDQMALPENRRAPLMDQLFHEKYWHGDARQMLPEADFKESQAGLASTGSLETWLTQRWEQIDGFKVDAKKRAEKAFFGRVAFYIWRVTLDVSKASDTSDGYHLFARKLMQSNEQFALISFNYETLLDRALRSVFRAPMISMQDYYNIPYIKPHGSINWLLPKRAEEQSFYDQLRFDLWERFSTAAYWMFNGAPLGMQALRVMYPEDPDLGQLDSMVRQFEQQYFYPLILMPLTIKQYGSILGFYENCVKLGREWLSAATDIYLLGYRAADEVIREMLVDVRRGTILHVISRNDAEEIAKRVLDWYPGILSRGEVSTNGFYHFVEHWR